jgi:hypothetical protein
VGKGYLSPALAQELPSVAFPSLLANLRWAVVEGRWLAASPFLSDKEPSPEGLNFALLSRLNP